MTTQAQPKIFFVKVSDNATKLKVICDLVKKSFENKARILISVPSEEAAKYIDQLLWKNPEESFLPHVIAHAASKESIIIVNADRGGNLNQAHIAINLCPDALQNGHEFSIIYELLDQSHPDKEALSKKRLLVYQSLGFAVDSFQNL